METTKELAARVRNAAVDVLPAGLRVAVETRPKSAIPTFDISVRTNAGEHHFSAAWAGKGWPADVERALVLAPGIDVVFVKRLSEGARQWLAECKVGWIDEDGSANIVVPTGLVVSREASTVPAPKDAPATWTRTMLAAAEAALAGVPPTVEAIEAATGISRGASANALARLEKLGLLERAQGTRGPGSARSVVNLDALIDEYAAAAATLSLKRRVILIHRLWKDPLEAFESEIGPALNRKAGSWAVTGAAASILLAPYLSDVTVVELYVDDDLFANRDRLAEVLGGRVVDRGQLIEVRALPTPMSARGPIVKGVHLALPARVYADLMAAGGRSAEAANHLRETIDVGPSS
jgi:hypothetical protein